MEFDRKPRMAGVAATAHAGRMIHFRLLGVPEDLAESIRRSRADGHGNHDLVPITVEEEHGSPCRVCLQDARPGEAVLLCSYSPFARARPYRSVGPIYVHAHRCSPYAGGVDQVPEQVRRRLLSLRAFDAADHMVTAEVVEGRALEAVLEGFLADPRVAQVHVHNARPGCYSCRIERSGLALD
jgi:hypothetical protein